jgi:hypothetical protein
MLMAGTPLNRPDMETITMNEDERTLYLNEKRGLIVRRDGPSLWVKEKGRAGIRVPVRLINMVFVFGNIKMDTGAITLFTENSIPVTFMNIRGEPLGIALPGHSGSSYYVERQKIIFESDQILERYKTWLTAMRRKLQVQTLKNVAHSLAMQYMDTGYREGDYRACIDKMRQGNQHRWRAAQTMVGNICAEMVIKKIIDAGLDPHRGSRTKEIHFGFAHDLCSVVLPSADFILLKFLKSSDASHFIVDTEDNCTLSKDGLKHLVLVFEMHKKMLHSTLDKIILSFFEFLREV